MSAPLIIEQNELGPAEVLDRVLVDECAPDHQFDLAGLAVHDAEGADVSERDNIITGNDTRYVPDVLAYPARVIQVQDVARGCWCEKPSLRMETLLSCR